MRPDGTRVKDLPPLVAAIPYIMPKRYDAWNSITENIDEEAVKAYIRHWRREGVRLNHMSVIIAAYYRAVLDNPKLNYFVMNGKDLSAQPLLRLLRHSQEAIRRGGQRDSAESVFGAVGRYFLH